MRKMFGPESEWPKENMTLEENIRSLRIHEQEFELRDAFAYSVFNKTKEKCLGAIYIDPNKSINYECEVFFWIRDDSIELENLLYQTVLNWLEARWPFSRIIFPGRSIHPIANVSVNWVATRS